MHITSLHLSALLVLLPCIIALPTNTTLTATSSLPPSFMIDMYNGAMVNGQCTGKKVAYVGGPGTIEGCWAELGEGVVCALSEGNGAEDYKICGYTDGWCKSECIQFHGQYSMIYGVPLQAFTVTNK